MTRGIYKGWRAQGSEVALFIVYAVEGFPDDPISEWMVPGSWHDHQPKEGQHGEEA
jgi:hypothetical protein